MEYTTYNLIKDSALHNWSDFSLDVSVSVLRRVVGVSVMFLYWGLSMKRIRGGKLSSGYTIHAGPIFLYYQTTEFLPAHELRYFKMRVEIIK